MKDSNSFTTLMKDNLFLMCFLIIFIISRVLGIITSKNCLNLSLLFSSFDISGLNINSCIPDKKSPDS